MLDSESFLVVVVASHTSFDTPSFYQGYAHHVDGVAVYYTHPHPTLHAIYTDDKNNARMYTPSHL